MAGMEAGIKRWLEMARQVLSQPLMSIPLRVLAAIGVYDTVLSEVVPASWAARFPKVRDVIATTTGWLPFWVWLLIGAAILVVASIEYACRRQPPMSNGELCRHVARASRLHTWRTSLIRALLIIIPSVSFVALRYCSANTTRLAKERTFSSVLARYASDLGPATTDVMIVPRASKSEFEHAIELWIVDPKGFYLLPLFDESRWEHYTEDAECPPLPEGIYCRGNEQERTRWWQHRLQRSIPRGLRPPFGATAVYINNDLSAFATIGWQKWDCEMDNPATPTFYQEFANAYALGIYPASYADDSAQIVILYKKGENVMTSTDKPAYQIIDLGSSTIVGSPCTNEKH